LGATDQLPEEDRPYVSRSYLLDRIAVMLGGRVAEKVKFRDVTSGAGDDLKQATQLARRMVCQWGMSDKLGPVTFRQGEEHVFLGRELAEQRDFSEHTARLIDEEGRHIVRDREEQAEKILTQNRDNLDTLAQALLKQETLKADDIERLLRRQPSPRDVEALGSAERPDEGST
jgi:cell division protease FtsH